MGQVVVIRPRRGEIWWGETIGQKGRPYLVLSRDSSIAARLRLVVAPVTTRVRRHVAELTLGMDEGLWRECVANFDELATIPASVLTRRLGALDGSRVHELCDVMRTSIDC